MARLWYDAEQALEVGDWVELVDDRWAPVGTPPPLMRVQSVSVAARQVTLSDPLEERSFDPALHPLLRRWDQPNGGAAPHHGIALDQADGSWFELEDGVEVQFEARDAHYERGDFWLIPARTATAGVLWPHAGDAPLALPPQGPARYLAPLARVAKVHEQPVDLRVRFVHIAEEVGSERHVPATALNETTVAEATIIRPPSARFRLRSVSTVEPGAVFPLHDGTTIGRADDAGIRLDHPDVSRHHAEFAIRDDVLTVMDLGSTNGTAVNGDALAERTPVALSVGDTIEIGSSELQLQVEEA